MSSTPSRTWARSLASAAGKRRSAIPYLFLLLSGGFAAVATDWSNTSALTGCVVGMVLGIVGCLPVLRALQKRTQTQAENSAERSFNTFTAVATLVALLLGTAVLLWFLVVRLSP
jgi:hypothetical protein